MKKLLYMGRPALGENLFATPCLDLLSKEYEITLLTPEFSFPVFRKYSFIKNVLSIETFLGNNYLPEKTFSELNYLTKTGDWYYAFHHELEYALAQRFNFCNLYGLKKYPVLFDKDIDACSNVHRSNRYVCRTRKYMLKLQLMSIQETLNYDCTVRCPTYISQKTSNEIIVYQGSKEKFRRLSNNTIQKFINLLPNAIYFVTSDTANKLNLIEKNIKFELTDFSHNNSIDNIIKIFEKSPRAMIGPDAGLTQLATAYKIPLIWLQSRIVIDWVIDPAYRKFCKIYRRKKLNCNQVCLGCVGSKHLAPEPSTDGVFILPEHGDVTTGQLSCKNTVVPSCLDYTDAEIQEIIQMID
jgi:ADP-heptose:LPS heptosyltransferase